MAQIKDVSTYEEVSDLVDAWNEAYEAVQRMPLWMVHSREKLYREFDRADEALSEALRQYDPANAKAIVDGRAYIADRHVEYNADGARVYFNTVLRVQAES